MTNGGGFSFGIGNRTEQNILRGKIFWPLRLVAQDAGFSVRRQGFDSPRGYLKAEPDKASVPLLNRFEVDLLEEFGDYGFEGSVDFDVLGQGPGGVRLAVDYEDLSDSFEFIQPFYDLFIVGVSGEAAEIV